MLVCSIIIHAQTQQTVTAIKGVVYDSLNNTPLANATVQLKHSKAATGTTNKGEFVLPIPASPDVLVVSHIGFKTVQMPVAPNTNLVIYLSPAADELQSVTVNTGYQHIPKERATGSFNTVNHALINRSVSTDIISRIENLTPGLLINHGDASKYDAISVRGRTTIYADAQPLIVLNDFPYNGDINNINPNDIESITVLKDAAAASIWGARAANGVIVITTKTGTTTAPQVEVSVNTTVQQKPNLFNVNQISGSDFAYLESFFYNNGYYNAAFTSAYHTPVPPVANILYNADAGLITHSEATAAINSIKNHDVRNDLDKYFYRTAINQQYAFNVSGNTPYVNYYMSAGYDDNTPSLTGQLYNRISLLSQNSFKPVKNMQVNVGINYIQTNSRAGNNAGYNYYSTAGKQYYPYASLADASGSALSVYEDYFKNWVDTAGGGKLFNWVDKPLADINEVENKTQTTDYLINTALSYKILPALSIEAKYQYEHQLIINSSLYKQDAYYTRNLLNNFSAIDPYSGAVTYNIPVGGIADASNGTLTSHQGRMQLNYNNAWNNNKHQLNAIAGFEISSSINSTAGSRLYGYDEDHNTINAQVNYNTRYLQFSYPGLRYVPSNVTIASNTDHFISYYANAAYTFKNAYTLSASARIDEANLFGVKTNEKGTPLWSAGASWFLNKENFYKLNWLPLLKLRLTYGFNGNISREATAYTTVLYNTGAITPLPIAFVNTPANPNLQWERTGTLNIGADFSLKNNVVSGTIEYYQKHARDLLGPAPLDPTLGIGDYSNPSFYGNVAGMNGNGVDVQINTKNINRKLQWNTYFIFSYTKSKVSEYLMPVSTNANDYFSPAAINPVIGKPLFSIYSFAWQGLDAQNGNPTGFVNGKQTEDYNSIYSDTQLDSAVYNGSAQPVVYGALRNEIAYKNFSLSFNISYKFGYYFRTSSVNYSTLVQNWNGSGDFAKRWQQPGDEKITHVPSLIYPIDDLRDYFYGYSSVLVSKADNIRLEDVNISYSFSNNQLKKIAAKQLRLFIYASNLGVLWKANKNGIDPFYNNIPEAGKSIALGLNIVF